MEDKLNEGTIIELIEEAKDYFTKLQGLANAVKIAKEQIEGSALQALEDIDDAFDLLTKEFVEAVSYRRQSLKKEVSCIQVEGVRPLDACLQLIASQLTHTCEYITEGQQLLETSTRLAVASDFIDRATFLGRLPAVPQLQEVPHPTVSLPAAALAQELSARVLSSGRVHRMGPVQLLELEEKPGSLLVHWEEVDLERVVDVSCFRLQMAHGNLASAAPHLLDANFHDVYQGPETQALVRDVRPGEPYTFRVCCRVEGDSEWSAWSLPHVATSHQEPFSWDLDNSHFTITNENKLATKVTAEPTVLFSKSAQFGPGHSIEFTVLECGAGCSDEGLGLAASRTADDSLLQPGALFLSAQGYVFVDGVEKTTRLPCLQKGSKVCFSCEHIRDNRIRVNIDSSNKAVTYDWKVNSPQLMLYFAVCFGQTGWKVLVE